MNCNEYYSRQAGGVLPYFAGAQYQRGHGLGSLVGSLLRSAMSLIKRGAAALGRGTLKTGVRIADDVLSGQGIKNAAKRRVTDAGRSLMRGFFAPGVRPRKRIKRAPARKGITSATRQLKRQTPKKREADIFDNDSFRTETIVRKGQDRAGSLYRTPDSDQHRRQPCSGTSTYGLFGLGWTGGIPDTWIWRRLPGSRQHDATRAGEGDTSQWGRSRLGRSRGSSQ